MVYESETWNKFDLDNNLIKEYEHWMLLVRKNQTKLDACILMIKNRPIERFSDANEEEFVEFGKIVKELENSLKSAFNYDKINYLMLMMKDKEVHFHILPRYNEPRKFADLTWEDIGGSNPLNQKLENSYEQGILDKIKEEIKDNLESA